MITAGASRVASGLLCVHAIAITPAGPMELVRSSISIVNGLPCEKARSAPAIIVSGPAQRSLALWPARSPSHLVTLSIESSDSFVASAAVSIATGWSEPVPGRELHPLKSSAFSRRTFSPTGPSHTAKAPSCHPLVQNGRQVRASGFVVETDGHQCHWLDNSKPAFKAPAEQGRVSGRHEDSRTLNSVAAEISACKS